MSKDQGGSGAIQVDVAGPVQDPPQRYAGLRILDNRIREVGRSGIFFAATTDATRPRATEPWPEASTGVVVRGNRLHGLDGDGIVPIGTDRALVERNVVSDGNRINASPLSPERGPVQRRDLDLPREQHRHPAQRGVRDGLPEGNGCDGTGYDIDYDQDGTVVQFNYSHDNEGGFILLCTDPDPRVAHVRLQPLRRRPVRDPRLAVPGRSRASSTGSASTTTRSSRRRSGSRLRSRSRSRTRFRWPATSSSGTTSCMRRNSSPTISRAATTARTTSSSTCRPRARTSSRAIRCFADPRRTGRASACPTRSASRRPHRRSAGERRSRVPRRATSSATRS